MRISAFTQIIVTVAVTAWVFILPVKAVAEQCGFSGEVYFIRRFRELHGRPPGRYRIDEEGK